MNGVIARILDIKEKFKLANVSVYIITIISYDAQIPKKDRIATVIMLNLFSTYVLYAFITAGGGICLIFNFLREPNLMNG